MGTKITYCDKDATGAGTGGDLANAYTSLSAWNAAEGTILNSGDIHICYFASTLGSADVTPLIINGWTISSGAELIIQALDGYYHNGKWTDTKPRLYIEDGTAITIWEDNVTLRGLQIGIHTPTANARSCISASTAAAGSVRKIEDCIIKGHNNNSYYSYLIYINDADQTMKISNTYIYNGGQNAGTVGIRGQAMTNSYLNNITIHNCYYSIRQVAGTLKAQNIISSDCHSGSGFVETSGTLYLVNCSSTDATASSQDGDGVSGNNRDSQTFSFTDSANGDFHLLITDTGARTHGKTLSSDPDYPITDDIDRVARNVPWDIGADQYLVAGSAGAFTNGLLYGKLQRRLIV